MVMPFTTTNGFIHILRHLQPNLIYLEEHLASRDGGSIPRLRTWFRYDIIIVVGIGGRENSNPLGGGDIISQDKGVFVVDTPRIGNDFEQRFIYETLQFYGFR